MAATVDISLPENLTIANVHGLHEELEALVGQHENDRVVIHAESVNRADTAGLQLLLAFVHTAKEHQITLDWQEPSEKLISAANVLGLEEALGIH